MKSPIETAQELYEEFVKWIVLHDDHPELAIQVLDDLCEKLMNGEKIGL